MLVFKCSVGWCDAPTTPSDRASTTESVSKEDLLEVAVGMAAVAIALGVTCHEHWTCQFTEMVEEAHGNLQKRKSGAGLWCGPLAVE